MKNLFRHGNWYKTISQTVIIFLLGYMGLRIWIDTTYSADFEAYCPLGGLQALGSYLTRGSLACSMSSVQIVMGLALMVGVLLLSKLFCGYICPLGTFSEWLGKLGEKFKIRFTITGNIDKTLRVLKYALLFVTFYFTLKSSELFCKKFDPYYTITSGFNGEIVVLYATLAVLILVFGSIFLRLFWCKYLCPLGAASNIFKFWWWFLGIMAAYVVANKFGIEMSYVWPLAILTTGGYLLEVFRMRKAGPSLMYITRNEEGCINCNLCTRRCPQGIDVASMTKVNHVDCNLCGDCLSACPEHETLQINRRNMRWFPATALLTLIVLGLILSSFWEVPTIDETWGTDEELAHTSTYTHSGLKNIKCYGSATTFANQMRRVNGIYGVSAYVRSHTVKIRYDKKLLNEEKIQRLIFTPVKRIVEPLGNDIDSVIRITTKVDKFFDPMDVYYLQQLLSQETGACAFETEFGCPVLIHFYFPKNNTPSKEDLKELIETRSLTYTLAGKENRVKLNYELVAVNDEAVMLSRMDYLKTMFTPTTMRFNRYNNYSGEVLKAYTIPMGQNANLKNRYSYLVSHLSNDPGVVGFETSLNEAGDEMGNIIFVDTLTSLNSIDQALHADSLKITKTNGETSKVPNPFVFNQKGEKRVWEKHE
jgi:ferredoxin